MVRRPVVEIGDGGWPMVDIGRLNRAITIVQLGPKSPPEFDAAGPVLGWTPIGPEILASVESVRGTDAVHAGQTTPQTYLEVTIWWQDGIDTGMRVRNGSKECIIQWIQNVNERDRVLVLNCLDLA